MNSISGYIKRAVFKYASFIRSITPTSSSEQSSASFASYNANMPAPFTIKASGTPKCVVIFLHGLGDNGAGWKQAFEEVRNSNVHYVFPNAPAMGVTLNFGMQMPAWFDIKSLEFDGTEDKPGIQLAAQNTRKLIAAQMEQHKLPSNKIILGGFSQGGATALYTALTHDEQLGGVMALSSWLPLHELFKERKENHSLMKQKCEIAQFHGDSDMMVKLKFGELTSKLLKSAGANATMKKYAGLEHSSSAQEMRDVKNFIDRITSS